MAKEDEELDIYSFSRREALFNSTYKTQAWFYRKVCRWFSKEFSTSIKEVESLDWYEVLVHYYESFYEQYTKKQLVDEIARLDSRIESTEEDDIAAFQKQLNDMLLKKQQSITKDTTDFSKPKPIDSLLFE